MNPVQRRHDDRKILLAVGGLVVAGVAGIALLAGWSAQREESAARSAKIRTSAAAVPASYQKPRAASVAVEPFTPPVPVEPIAPEPVEPVAKTAIDPERDPVAGGLEAYGAREFALAASYFAKAADEAPQRAWTHYMLGLSLWKDDRADEAAVAMEQSAGLDGDSIKTWINLSRIQNDRGAFEEAMAAARQALAVDSEDAKALFLEGRSLRNMGLADEAIASLRRSVAIDPDNGYAQNLLGLALMEGESSDEALAVLTRAAELVPDVAYVHNNLGMALELADRPGEAVGAYREATAADATHERAAANLARLEPTVPVSGDDSAPADPTAAVATAEPIDMDVAPIGDTDPETEASLVAEANVTDVAEVAEVAEEEEEEKEVEVPAAPAMEPSDTTQ